MSEMVDKDSDGKIEVAGHVKWFDTAKGFGFIVPDSGGADILLHGNVLRNYGQNSVADGTRIRILAQRTERGIQAVSIIALEAPAQPGAAPLADFAEFDPAFLAALPLEPARVKWFDKAKGFGFANLFGAPDDIFLHIEVLRSSGFADLQPGEAVALKVIEGKRGRMATAILAWDAALHADERGGAA
ncbi:cold-shock protein [Limimaricola pyoseonensis]|uniref:Cold-shock DNA-binding protein family n=1 Tax=Limimaricola pyoseonensis TaxID=521013 RepID=A0A1G7GWK0_9RHOB|nr:cold shock domain-containing protein [Limimaricola pyoseonensis]SDE92309.1 cold-shock DNA-binding protein family [Limimaricola pyoseonensis]